MSSKPHYEADTGAISRLPTQDCFLFKPRAFNIVWGNDRRYWRIPPRSSSSQNGGDEPAELVQVSWLEVTGQVALQASTSYQITFRLSFKANASGWTGCPVFLMAKVGRKGRYSWRKLKELDNLPKEPTDVPSNDEPFTVEAPANEPDKRLYFGLYEVWSGKWKGGLRVHQATVQKVKKPS